MKELDVLQKTCVQIYNSDTYHGSAVLVETGGTFYVISAAHVFAQDIEEPICLTGFYGRSEVYGVIDFSELVGDEGANLKHDIAVIKVENTQGFPQFPKIKFCDDITFPGITLVFRGTQKKSSTLKPHSVTPCSVDTVNNEGDFFCLKVPLEAYTDMKGSVGAEVLGGYSGSGIFIKETKDTYLVGIAQNIEKDDFTGVNCRSIRVIKDSFIPDIEISDFHGGNTQLKLNISEVRKSITKEMIDKRKHGRYGDIENITRKMNSFIENWTPEDLDGFINDILVWENIEHTKIRNNSSYREPIENAKAIWASGNKKYQVSSIQKGNERFHKILDELIEILKEELKDTPIRSSSTVIAAGEVARLLANCNLDFKQ